MTIAPELAAELAGLERRWAEEQGLQAQISRDEAYARIDEFLLPVGPETGRLMHDIVRQGRLASILEIGSSYGYSTLWLADAARAIGGRVTSLELHPGKIAAARAALDRVALAPFVTFVEGDALASLDALAGPFDFVLIDLWKDLYIPCLDRLDGRLAPGAIIVADNMTFPPDNAANAAAYRAAVRARGDMESVLLPIGAGIEVSRRVA